MHSVKFAQETNFIINNEEVSLHEAQQLIDPTALKQLLNPQTYVKLMSSAFEKKVQSIEPPEQDFNEPDEYDRDYDRDY